MAKPVQAILGIDPSELRQWLGDGHEIALIDVRDGGPFSRSHLLLAANIPLAQIEVRAPALLPRRDVRLVLMDDGAGAAELAASLLRDHGYINVYVLRDGVAGWGRAGYELFSGTNVPSKAFGEFVEDQQDTPRIGPQELDSWLRAQEDVVVVDARPLEEYRMVSIPGAANCPGAELVLRLPALVKSPKTKIVVNCAGRTRSIIGSQSLRNAGLPNPIYALKNGTMGWELAGMTAARGRDNMVALPDEVGLAVAKRFAADVAAKFGVRSINSTELERFLAEWERTTYVFDVRLPDAFQAGHRPGSINAPGGQLVQATDTFAPVRNARIVLIDEHQVQSVMTAHWLGQMGWSEVFVLRDGLSGHLETGAVQVPMLGEDKLTVALMEATALRDALNSSAVEVIDVGESYWYRAAHVPGSWYAMRSQLAQALTRFETSRPLVFACSDGRVSRFAAEDAKRMGRIVVGVLRGGRAAWRAAGLPVEATDKTDTNRLLTATEDMWYPPWARSSNVEEAMQQYLTWEVNLLDQIAREPYFKLGPTAGQAHPTRATP